MTSAEAIDSYPAGEKILSGQGPAWHGIKLSMFSLTSDAETFFMPAIVEPFIVWIISGSAETKERENADQEWQHSTVNAGSLFLTEAGAPYEFSWRRLSKEPFHVMMLVLETTLVEEALTEAFGQKSRFAKLKDVSGFTDEKLVSLLKILKLEARNKDCSKLLVRGIGQAIAVHIARNYAVLTEHSRENKSSLPVYKLNQIIDWMKIHLDEEFSLAKLASLAKMSEFHFNRLFKQATGLPPSKYHIKLRVDQAKKLLRETKKTIIEISQDVGYANPSHFARLFKKETGETPNNYRRQK